MTTTRAADGVAYGLIYSGWHVVAGAVLGSVYSLLCAVGPERVRPTIWQHFVTSVAGALAFGLIPSGYWMT